MTDDTAPAATGPATTGAYARYRLRRDAAGLGHWFADRWHRRRFRWLTYAVVLALVGWIALWAVVARGLPDAKSLLEYQPPLPTVVRGASGEPVHSYARERRVQLSYEDLPPQLIQAYLAAEDKTFFSHGGIDYTGLAGAVIDYISKAGSNERAKGGSTITQQVAKNILLSDEYSLARKFREMVLARRIESVLTKQQILELYLNEIPLGRRSFGVQAAARAYFDKDVGNLDLSEAAFLAILPKAPEKYGRAQNSALALERRNFVLGQMEENGWISAAQRAEATARPLGLTATSISPFRNAGGYYMEEVRRELIDKFGETADDGPLSVYAGGLWVRTPYEPEMQAAATKALRAGLLRFDAGRGWSGAIATIEADDQWKSRLASSYVTIDYEDWRIAALLSKNGREAEIGFADGSTGRMTAGNAMGAFDRIAPGDLIAVKPMGGDEFALRNVPKVSGGMVVEDPHSGRIYAMQGGFSNRISSFNRATQAERQPGSTIKPFVYSAALDNGMTPASIIVDQPFCVWQGANLGDKCFRNFSGGYAGPKTMRWGIEQSRNLMTVQAANATGMDKVVATIKRMKIGDYPPYLSMALGAGETTVMKMTNAFSMLANHGRELDPRVIDYVQDRNGKVVWPAKWKACDGCNRDDWDGRPMPRFEQTGRQLLDPLTAYQMVHILEGVVTRGTATRLRAMDRPMMGKTGTTNGPKEVWFVGGTPDLITGVYVGYDQPRDMGGWAQGGRVSAPIALDFFQAVIPKDAPKIPFVAPADIRMVRIDRTTGKRVYGVFPDSENDDPKAAIIWEAFKPETEPKRTIRKEEIPQPKKQQQEAVPQRTAPVQRKDTDFLEDQGGIY
ncbi:MAG: PBP1A family penicillin-binding protein [Sphingomonadales bacterium]|nr:PBP1A family penicillin-binding protein [Sphingomonadales bacterium]